MAINPNNELDAMHVCYLAGTGGGKTAAVKLINGMIENHVAIFDLYGDYKHDARRKSPFNGLGGRVVYHYKTRKQFAQAFADAWRSRLKFVVAYSPEFSGSLNQAQLKEAKQKELHWFGRLMWAASDGKRRLDIVIEELAKLSSTAGKDDSIVGELATGGRKFGLVLHTIFQRSQEVPKTIWNNSPRKVLGAQESKHDAKLIAVELDAQLSDVIQLSKLNAENKKKRLHYLVKAAGGIGNINPYFINIDKKSKDFGKCESLTFDELRAN
jgi:hypothetical protein